MGLILQLYQFQCNIKTALKALHEENLFEVPLIEEQPMREPLEEAEKKQVTSQQ